MKALPLLVLFFSSLSLAQVRESVTEQLRRAVNEGDLVAAEVALKNGANPDAQMSQRRTSAPLIVRSTFLHRPAMVKLLLRYNADVNTIRPLNQQTPLAIAARYDDEDVARVLLAHPDIDLNGKPEVMKRPIDIAANNNSVKVGKLLLQKGRIEMDHDLPFHCTLERAAERGHREFVDLLISDAGPNRPSKECIELALKRTTDSRIRESLLAVTDPASCP